MTLEQLYLKNRKSFIFKILPLVHNYSIAEELVQDAFVKAITKKEQYDEKRGHLKGWFVKILFSCVWDYIRDIKRRPPTFTIDSVMESDLLSYEDVPNLTEYLEGIQNPKHKQALIGYFVIGNTYRELSVILNLTQDSVRKVVQRFRDSNKELADGF